MPLVPPVVLEAFRDQLIEGIRRVIQADPGNTLDGKPLPTFLADPAPTNPFGAFQHRAGRAVCDRWARGSRPSILPGREAYYRNLCGPYLGSGGPQLPSTGPYFPGGQCSGVTYRVTYTYLTGPCSNPYQTTNGPFTLDIVGPISRGRTETPISATVKTVRLLINGVAREVFNVGLNCSVNPSALAGGDWGIFRVVRLDGLPDNCGSLPVEFEPGTRNPTPDPRPGPVGGPIGFPFPNVDVTINIDGSVNISIGDGGPDSTVNPEGGPPSPPVFPPPGDTGVPGTPEGTGVGGDSEGEAPAGSVLVGLKLDLVEAPENANVYAPGVYRGAAYIYMGTPTGLDQDFAGSMLSDGQFVYAEKDNLTKWRVKANSGYDWDVTPYYRDVEQA